LSLSVQERQAQINQADTRGYYRVDRIATNDFDAAAGTGKEAFNVWVPRNLDLTSNSEDRTRTSGTLVVQYAPTEDLTLTFDGLYSKFEVESQVNNYANWFTPGNFRDFEVDALTRTIIKVSGQHWAKVLPKSKQHEFAKLTKPRTMLIISDPVDPRAMQAVSDLGATFRSVTGGKTKVVEYVEANDAASPGVILNGVSHIVVLLTGGFVIEHGCLDKQIFERIVNNNNQIPVIYAYSVELGWDFNKFFSLPNSEIVRRIGSHEILAYRNKRPPSLEYEHMAMAVEMLRRAKV
jgi:hypothetical protein